MKGKGKDAALKAAALRLRLNCKSHSISLAERRLTV
jgi:hypothetical protein